MKLKLASDIHGAYPDLASQLTSDDTLIMLGDYVNLIDFFTLEGVLRELFSREEIKQVLEWIKQKQKAKAREFIQRFTTPDGDRYPEAVNLIKESYVQMGQEIKCKTYLLYGNTDYPDLIRDTLGKSPNFSVMDGEVIELDGLKIGFVSGSPPTPWTFSLPGVVSEQEYQAKIASLGPVDILCSHVPPKLSDLSYDTIAQRDEMGSQALLEYIHEFQPSWVFFGHVHNPRRRNLSLNKSQLVNLGYFRNHKQIYSLGI
jgi:Icc-related predicted phosphoesterase